MRKFDTFSRAKIAVCANVADRRNGALTCYQLFLEKEEITLECCRSYVALVTDNKGPPEISKEDFGAFLKLIVYLKVTVTYKNLLILLCNLSQKPKNSESSFPRKHENTIKQGKQFPFHSWI